MLALVVDDSSAQLTVLRSMLQHFDLDVLQATNVAAASELASSFEFDLILCDLALSGEDGSSFYFQFRSVLANERTPFIFVSGQEPGKLLLKEMANDDFADSVLKPVRLQDLEVILSRFDLVASNANVSKVRFADEPPLSRERQFVKKVHHDLLSQLRELGMIVQSAPKETIGNEIDRLILSIDRAAAFVEFALKNSGSEKSVIQFESLAEELRRHVGTLFKGTQKSQINLNFVSAEASEILANRTAIVNLLLELIFEANKNSSTKNESIEVSLLKSKQGAAEIQLSCYATSDGITKKSDAPVFVGAGFAEDVANNYGWSIEKTLEGEAFKIRLTGIELH